MLADKATLIVFSFILSAVINLTQLNMISEFMGFNNRRDLSEYRNAAYCPVLVHDQGISCNENHLEE